MYFTLFVTRIATHGCEQAPTVLWPCSKLAGKHGTINLALRSIWQPLSCEHGLPAQFQCEHGLADWMLSASRNTGQMHCNRGCSWMANFSSAIPVKLHLNHTDGVEGSTNCPQVPTLWPLLFSLKSEPLLPQLMKQNKMARFRKAQLQTGLQGQERSFHTSKKELGTHSESVEQIEINAIPF